MHNRTEGDKIKATRLYFVSLAAQSHKKHFLSPILSRSLSTTHAQKFKIHAIQRFDKCKRTKREHDFWLNVCINGLLVDFFLSSHFKISSRLTTIAKFYTFFTNPSHCVYTKRIRGMNERTNVSKRYIEWTTQFFCSDLDWKIKIRAENAFATY